MNTITYQTILDSGIALKEIETTLGLNSIRVWKTRGIPAKYQAQLSEMLHSQEKCNKIAAKHSTNGLQASRNRNVSVQSVTNVTKPLQLCSGCKLKLTEDYFDSSVQLPVPTFREWSLQLRALEGITKAEWKELAELCNEALKL